jgi:hypothetical protein
MISANTPSAKKNKAVESAKAAGWRVETIATPSGGAYMIHPPESVSERAGREDRERLGRMGVKVPEPRKPSKPKAKKPAAEQLSLFGDKTKKSQMLDAVSTLRLLRKTG